MIQLSKSTESGEIMKRTLDINDILREFYKISGFRISIHDTEFNEIYAYPQRLSPYCSAIQSDTHNKKECVKYTFFFMLGK